ncbi:MAG: hypothetical protein QOF97_2809, partial [Acidimicrobiaceae bacterium]
MKSEPQVNTNRSKSVRAMLDA